jgi:hypothetical protein
MKDLVSWPMFRHKGGGTPEQAKAARLFLLTAQADFVGNRVQVIWGVTVRHSVYQIGRAYCIQNFQRMVQNRQQNN